MSLIAYGGMKNEELNDLRNDLKTTKSGIKKMSIQTK